MISRFESREDIIKALFDEFGVKGGFNNTPTNKHVEKFWTYNRLSKYYYSYKERQEYFNKTEC